MKRRRAVLAIEWDDEGPGVLALRDALLKARRIVNVEILDDGTPRRSTVLLAICLKCNRFHTTDLDALDAHLAQCAGVVRLGSLAVECSFCEAPVGQPCRLESGRATVPHAARWRALP